MPFLGIRNIKKKAYLGEMKINFCFKCNEPKVPLDIQGELPRGNWIKGSGTQEIDCA